MSKLPLFLGYYFLGLIFLVIFFGIGYSIVKLVSNRLDLSRHKALFFSIFFGSIVAIVVFSLIMTRFKTINAGFLIVIAFLVFEIRKLPVINKVSTQKTFLTARRIVAFAIVF